MFRFFFRSLIKNILTLFTGKNIFWHILAIILTYILVITNADWYYLLYVRSSALLPYSHLATVLGGILPIILPAGIIVLGYISHKKQVSIIGSALLQAVLTGSLVSSTYKAFTGRLQPNLHDLTTNISGAFNFGFLEHGVFWGWPSSHTTIAFAMAFTIIKLFPKNNLLRVSVFLYALYIGVGVSFSIHWFSDFIAGAIIGTLIGLVIGESFKGKKI